MLSGSFQRFKEHAGTLRSVQEHVTCPYLERDESNPLHYILFKVHFNIIVKSTPMFQNWSLFFRFPY